MAVTKRVELDCIGFNVSNDPVKQGRTEIRWRKMVFLDDEPDPVATEYHRVQIDVDTDIERTIAEADEVFVREGYSTAPASDVSYITAVTNLAWTPEVRAAVAADRAEKAAKAEEERMAREKAAAEEQAAKDASFREQLIAAGVKLE